MTKERALEIILKDMYYENPLTIDVAINTIELIMYVYVDLHRTTTPLRIQIRIYLLITEIRDLIHISL